MKIAICGSHSVGKTTLLDKIELKNHKIISEIARALIDEKKLPHKMDSNELFDFEISLAKEQILAEEGDFIIDRSVYDVMAYSMELERYNEIVEYLETNMTEYDYLFYIPVEFSLKKDRIRSGDRRFQFEIDKRIQALLLKYKPPYTKITGTLDERMKKINNILCLISNTF